MRIPFKTDDFTPLAVRLRESDSLAAEKLYEKLFDKVFGFCMNKTSNRTTAEDLTQDIFLKLIDRIETFDETRGNFLVWFWQLARNTVTDFYRKQKEVHFSDIEENKIEESAGQLMPQTIDSKVEMERISTFLSSISSEEKELFELHFVADLKYSDIAEVLGKPEGNLRVAVSRLKEKIRRNFA